MKCNKCGFEVSEGKYCTNCGEKIEIVETSEPITPEKTNNEIKKGLATASLIIGIISLVFSIFVSIFVLPLALTGLILGIVGLAKKQKAVAGVVLNSIGIFISVVILFVYIAIFGYFFNKNIDKIDVDKVEDYINDIYNDVEDKIHEAESDANRRASNARSSIKTIESNAEKEMENLYNNIN